MRRVWGIRMACLAAALAAATAGCGVAQAPGRSSAAAPVRSVVAAPIQSAAAPPLRARGGWTILARSPLPATSGATMIWDGRELLELGGQGTGPAGGPPLDGGAAYDPATVSWRTLASAPAAVEPANAASVWTGRQVFLYGGPTLPHEAFSDVAGLYDPTTDTWTVTSRAPVPALNSASAVWTGHDVVLAGMSQGAEGASRLEIAEYDPTTNAWATLTPPIPAADPTESTALVATDDGVLLWSLWSRSEKLPGGGGELSSGIDLLRLTPSGTWTRSTWPLDYDIDDPIFTGSRVLVPAGQGWCGLCPGPFLPDTHGYLLNPRTLRLTSIPHGPLDALGPQVLWTGKLELELNSGGEISGPEGNVSPGDTATWNPRTRRWTRGPRAPRQLGQDPGVWDGHALLVLAADGALLAYRPS